MTDEALAVVAENAETERVETAGETAVELAEIEAGARETEAAAAVEIAEANAEAAVEIARAQNEGHEEWREAFNGLQMQLADTNMRLGQLAESTQAALLILTPPPPPPPEPESQTEPENPGEGGGQRASPEPEPEKRRRRRLF